RRRDAASQVRRLLVCPRNWRHLRELGTPLPDERDLSDGLRIRKPQSHTPAGTLTARLQARLSAPHDRHAAAERAREAAKESRVEAVAVGQQHHDGDDAPRDAEHRESRTHAVAEEAGHGLARDFLQHSATHDSNRNASTGGNWAARRAGYVDVVTPTTT